MDCDIKLTIESKNINFYLWINLFYITLENFLITINDYISNSLKESPAHLGDNKSNFDTGKSLLTFEPNNKNAIIELCDLTTIKKKAALQISKKDLKFDDNSSNNNQPESVLNYKDCTIFM